MIREREDVCYGLIEEGEELNQMIDDGKSQASVDAAQGESASQFGLVERRVEAKHIMLRKSIQDSRR